MFKGLLIHLQALKVSGLKTKLGTEVCGKSFLMALFGRTNLNCDLFVVKCLKPDAFELFWIVDQLIMILKLCTSLDDCQANIHTPLHLWEMLQQPFAICTSETGCIQANQGNFLCLRLTSDAQIDLLLLRILTSFFTALPPNSSTLGR